MPGDDPIEVAEEADRTRLVLRGRVAAEHAGRLHAAAVAAAGRGLPVLVRFQPNTGRALAKPLGGRHLSGIVRDEEAFGRDLLRKVQSTGTGTVTMF